MNPNHANKYSMINLKRVRITFPNPLQASEHDSMPSFRNWIETAEISLEKAEFSIWDKDGMFKYLEDVNIKDASTVCDSINKAWHEYDMLKSNDIH